MAGILVASLLAGCPTQTPDLNATPKAIDFGNSNQVIIRISNVGSGSMTWLLDEVMRATSTSGWVVQDIPWLSTNVSNGVTTTGTDYVEVTVDTTQLTVGTHINFGIQITVPSTGEIETIPLSITVAPTLIASPSVFALTQDDNINLEFSLTNIGNVSASWEIFYIVDLTNPDAFIPIPAGITVSPTSGTTNIGATSDIDVSWTTAPLTDFGLRVVSDAGDSIIRFTFGQALPNLQVSPNRLILYTTPDNEVPDGEDPVHPASIVTITNNSGAERGWDIAVINSVTGGDATELITATPNSNGTMANLTEDLVEVRVIDADNTLPGSGNYELHVSEQGSDNFMIIPIVIEELSLPEITLSEPPDPVATRPEVVETSLLDLGQYDVQGSFYIANTGPRNSNLFFRIEHEDQLVVDPLIVGVDPLTGDVAGPERIFFYPSSSNTMIDGQEVVVTINRANLTEDVEFRTITVYAVAQNDPNQIISPVEPKEIQVRVERPPLSIEGAINRSRPPFLKRFVFTLRDQLGEIIPTRTEDDLEKITFSIFEEEQPLDLDETNFFVNGPELLKVNMVIMLDYTGSAYQSGTSDPLDPLAPGEAIEAMKEATKDLIDQLPEHYNVMLMYFHDRQQLNRVLHPFTTDHQALKDAIDGFNFPSALHGVSDIYDALFEGINHLAAADPGDVLPFDDADIRPLIFVTNGVDNASFSELNTVATHAEENRVRLYPVLYDLDGLQGMSNMIELSSTTSGFLYDAGTLERMQEAMTTLWNEFYNQIVLTYVSPRQSGGTYRIQADYEYAPDQFISGQFERDGIFWGGDVRAGQIALNTAGLPEDTSDSEIFVRTDYVPRGVTDFRMRFLLKPIAGKNFNTTENQSNMEVEIAPEGLLDPVSPLDPTWRLISEGDGIYRILTDSDNALPFGSFGNLLRITVPDLTLHGETSNEFLMEMRLDNDIYYAPATPGNPSETVYFQYPNGPNNFLRPLFVTPDPDIAGPASELALLIQPLDCQGNPLDPELLNVWDCDEDGIPDFNDPDPTNPAIPGPMTFPNPATVPTGENTIILTIVNNRLDTMDWEIDEGSAPSWITVFGYGDSGLSPTPISPLAPGASTEVHLTVDRSGLADGFFEGTLTLSTFGLFEEEEIDITLVVVGGV